MKQEIIKEGKWIHKFSKTKNLRVVTVVVKTIKKVGK